MLLSNASDKLTPKPTKTANGRPVPEVCGVTCGCTTIAPGDTLSTTPKNAVVAGSPTRTKSPLRIFSVVRSGPPATLMVVFPAVIEAVPAIVCTGAQRPWYCGAMAAVAKVVPFACAQQLVRCTASLLLLAAVKCQPSCSAFITRTLSNCEAYVFWRKMPYCA